jgi:hypothetical protein
VLEVVEKKGEFRRWEAGIRTPITWSTVTDSVAIVPASAANVESAAYEGIYRLPDTAKRRPPAAARSLFERPEGVVRSCPECSKKKLPLGALIVL